MTSPYNREARLIAQSVIDDRIFGIDPNESKDIAIDVITALIDGGFVEDMSD